MHIPSVVMLKAIKKGVEMTPSEKILYDKITCTAHLTQQPILSFF
jgi:hypothetical protein